MKKILILFLMLSLPAFAQTDLERAREEAKQTASEKKDMAKELERMRGALIEMTRNVQAREKALLKIKQRREETDEKIKSTEETLKKRRRSLAQLILALQRLDRLPPQALLARPGTPIDTARSYYLLQEVLPELSTQAEEVKRSLDELALLRVTQQDQEAKLKAESVDLAKQQAELEKSIGERRARWKETSKAHKEAAARAAKLARKSANLQDLVGGLGATEKNRDSVKESLFGWFAKSGDEMPVVGVVETGYGDKTEGGNTSQGLRIRANAGAVVVSPSYGTIKFAGPFRQYKLLVIVQHENGDHSLLGGLNELYTRVGERVTGGEPIGKLSGDSTRTASLYYERRHRGKPVDPRRVKN